MSINYSLSQLGNIITTDANGAITSMNTSSYSANLGPVGNVTITGGSNGQVLSTNGSGALSWTTVSSGDTSDWVSAPITITSTITNPTKGGTVVDYIRYKPLGNKTYLVQMHYYQTSAGTAGNGLYLFTLPGGLQFDTTKHYVNNNGGAGSITAVAPWNAIIDGGTGTAVTPGTGIVISPLAYDATRFYISTTGFGNSNPNYYGYNFHMNYFQLSNVQYYFKLQFIFIATT